MEDFQGSSAVSDEGSGLEESFGSQVLSFDGEETASEDESALSRLRRKDKNSIREKTEEFALKCLNKDISAALRRYKLERKEIKKKNLSKRRMADIKRIRTVIKNQNKCKTRDEYVLALKKAVSEIKGGKLFFNKSKSTLRDTLNEIIHKYSTATSFQKEQFYSGVCHYTKIQKTLSGMNQVSVTSLGRWRDVGTNQRVENNNNDVGVGAPQNLDELEALRRRNKELEDENAALRSRVKITRSGGGSGDSKQSKSGKSPPNNYSINGEDSTEDPASGSGLLVSKKK
ncbi:MAG: hypothetical protein SFW07_06595 [Gammaproteobacteria bacterium]|nr:hypothetical protein [Gammaproteobacteria bacterium]